MERIDSLWLGTGPMVSGGFRIDSGVLRVDSNIFVIIFIPNWLSTPFRLEKSTESEYLSEIPRFQGRGFTFHPPYLEFRPRNSNSLVTRFTSENVSLILPLAKYRLVRLAETSHPHSHIYGGRILAIRVSKSH
ncbi:hypothetical protein PIB30_007407 [Stylosanthes scabra]|uniref:Uncharacterized protein n=1 Tax=Stylosanthes scabra TaxID=79078 RepID=A0ABU6Q4Q9_9FABA|nr:hypothetical protein [Stylosanthes scabra]